MLNTAQDGVETMLETGLEPPDNVEEEFIEGQPCYENNEGVGSDLLEHFVRFSRHGNLCEEAIGFYSDMPRRALSPVETAVCRFLKALDSGTGVSMATMQSLLTYRKEGDDFTAKILPKDVRTCLKIVRKVMHNPSRVTFLHDF